MAITSISRNFTGNPNLVYVVTSDNLATITTAGYLTAQATNIEALQNGEFQWETNDYVLIQYSGGEAFFTYNSSTLAFVAAATVPGTLSNTLSDGNIFVGSAANVATGVNPSGDIDVSNTGVFSITAGAIVNADVNAAAAIAFSKLAALPSAQILLGSAGNVATATAVTGDISIDNTGLTAISTGVIVNADINAAASIAWAKMAALTSAHILVGSAGNVATDVAVSGVIAMSNTGVTSFAAGAIVNADINAAAAIAFSKLAALTDAHILVGSGANVATDVAVSGDATLANTGALTLGTVVNAAKAATYAPEATTAGMPVLHVFNMVAGATATRTIATAQKITVVDAWAVNKGAGTAGDTVQVKNAAGTAITNALDMNVADTSLVRAGTIDDAQRVVAAGANLQCTVTDGGGADVPAMDVYVLCYVTP